MTVTRFAPSPTGLLHVGNLRTAVMNWALARQTGGTFILRIDDTDAERSEQRYADAIRRDLEWLGLTWDREERQSARFERYHAAAERLRSAGRLYDCFETPLELDLKRKKQLNMGLPPVYDRAALELTETDRARLTAAGRRPHQRFLLERREIPWNDLIRGPQRVVGASLSDPVLFREDGQLLYTLASVVDDAEMGVTHVVRGADHVTNTGAQIQIFAALAGRRDKAVPDVETGISSPSRPQAVARLQPGPSSVNHPQPLRISRVTQLQSWIWTMVCASPAVYGPSTPRRPWVQRSGLQT